MLPSLPRLPLLPLLALLPLASACTTETATTAGLAAAPAPQAAPQALEPADTSRTDNATPRPRGTADVLGKTPEAVIELLGPPTLDRTEATTRHLQFGGPPCILDVYFRPPAEGGPAAAIYAEARMLDGRDADASACITRRIRDLAEEQGNSASL